MNRRKSGAWAAIWLLGLATLAVTGAGLPAGRAAAQGSGELSYNGVTFSYDTALATSVRGATVPGNVGQDMLIYEIRPTHLSFAFAGYPAPGRWSPQIRVIPLAAYKAAQAQSNISAELSALEGYLGGDPHRLLPALPAVNEQRIINENVAPIAGSGLAGVRFVAAYAQGPLAVTADNLTYMFLGITPDQQYYVEGTFPVALRTPLAPAPDPPTVENVQAYNAAVAERLRNTAAAGFTPPLDTLDKMMGSIRVTTPGLPGMPTTGAGTVPAADRILGTLALATILVLAGLVLARLGKATQARQ